MIPIRFDRSAMITGSLIIGLFLLVTMRVGIGMAPRSGGTTDTAILFVVAAAAIYGSLFYCGHRLLRWKSVNSRKGYAGIGAIAALVAFAIVAGGPNLHTALLRGTLIFTLAVPAMAGSLTGFIYQRRAGYETEGDEPAQLANAVGTEDGDDALVATGTADYFDGPLQVKTSPGAVALAAVLGSSILMLSNFLMMAWDGVPGGLPPFMQMPGFGVSNAIAGGAMFMAIGTYVAHLIVRGIGKIGYGAYALAGLAGPLIFTFMFAVIGMGVGSFLLFSQFIVPSIAAMTTYRRFAGLEPKPIHEDIEVSDVRNLVGANHPRRRYGRVVKTSRH